VPRWGPLPSRDKVVPLRWWTRVRLTRLVPTHINGIDLSSKRKNDVVELPRREAATLIACGWAVPVDV
jgi:hypothetical protein